MQLRDILSIVSLVPSYVNAKVFPGNHILQRYKYTYKVLIVPSSVETELTS